MKIETNGISQSQSEDFISRRWFYFDTNCISQLAKMCKGEQHPKIRKFVSGKHILITTPILKELRKDSDVLATLETALLGSNLFLVPDMATF